MSKNNQSRPTVLVTDGGRGSAIAIVRSLGQRGWRVIVADSDPRSLGFRSRYAAERLVYPSPEASPRELVATLRQAADDMAVDLIIPVTDAIILPLSQARSQFDGVCKLALPDAAGLDVVTNKLRTLELANSLGVPTPQTCLVETVSEAAALGARFGWPIVLKPQRSRVYRDKSAIETYSVCYGENPERLAEQMQRFEGRCPVLLQEYCAGTGLGVEILADRGRVLAAFQHKRLREIPISGGVSAFRESVALDPVLYGHAERLMKALNWTGLAMVEFKVGRDGPKLMEINGRVWGSLPLAVHSGMDFPGLLAELYLFGPPEPNAPPQTSYTIGVRSRNLELDLKWIASVLRGKRKDPFFAMPSRFQGVAALLGLFNPVYKFDILSWEDPLPGLADIPRIIHKYRGKLKQAV